MLGVSGLGEGGLGEGKGFAGGDGGRVKPHTPQQNRLMMCSDVALGTLERLQRGHGMSIYDGAVGP